MSDPLTGFPAVAPDTRKLPYAIRYRGWRLAGVLLAYGCGLAICAVAAAGVLSQGRGLDLGTTSVLAVVGMAAAFAVYRLYLLASPGVIFHADRIDKRGLFGWRSLSRIDIQGVGRTVSTRSGSYFDIVPRPGAGPSLRLDGWLRDDPVVASWLRGATDPAAQAVAADRAAILADPRYGAGEAQRADALASAKTLVQVFSVACAALAVALALFAPLTPAFLLISVLPIGVGAAIVARSNGLIVWVARNRARPAVLLALLPLAAMALRCFLMVHFVPEVVVWGAAAGVGILAAAVQYTGQAEALGGARAAPGMGILAALAAFGLINLVDVVLDGSMAQVARTTVSGHHISHGRSTTYYLDLGPWGDQPAGETSVSSDLYGRAWIGSLVCVAHHPGALAIGWYDITLCPGQSQSQSQSQETSEGPGPAPAAQPTADPNARFYPDRAQRKMIEGSALVECQVTDVLSLTACKVVSETPAGYGFGAAAVDRVQSGVRLSRLPKDGGRTYRTKVVFKLAS